MTKPDPPAFVTIKISTHMPLARHDMGNISMSGGEAISTHMPLARHDVTCVDLNAVVHNFYSHASCEA